MIAADTSSLIAYIAGDTGADGEFLDNAIATKSLALPPFVISELLSDPNIKYQTEYFIGKISVLDIMPGFWHRAGKLRAMLLGKRLKAKLADAFIAQSCIDHNVPLITRDNDFLHYAKHCGLKLYDE